MHDIAGLVAALHDPRCYAHPVDRVVAIETHISWVLLAGEFAYKLKKPVHLPFLDFSTAQARLRCCREEVRLNRRTAPDIYLDVVPIGGAAQAPRVGQGHPVLEHAVRMRRFPQEALFSRLALDGRLEGNHVDALADSVAAFHQAIAGGRAPPGLGTAAEVIAPALENFAEMAALGLPPALRGALERLRQWTQAEGESLRHRFDQRLRDGFVRECHGDLHLGNALMLDGKAVLFDGIEFSERLRWTDVVSDVAFAFMDLVRGAQGLGWRFLDRYLQQSGDYAGLAALRFHAVYRAVVRAKIALVRSGQLHAADARRSDAIAELHAYLDLAQRLSGRPAAVLVAMHGVSGSGKSTVAAHLLGALGAVRLRSDVERKRLHGLDARARTDAGPGEGMYRPQAGDRTYEHLARLAREVLGAGFAVVVDAACLERRRRDALGALARECGAAFVIASCSAPEALMRERIARRGRAGLDASDAGLAVLERQLAAPHDLEADEAGDAVFLDTAGPEWRAGIDRLAQRFRFREA